MKEDPRVSRYREDPEYRERVRKRRRESYRKKMAGTRKTCANNLAHLTRFGKKRALDTEGSRRVTTFTISELAPAIGYKFVTLYGWIKRGWFPEPSHVGFGDRKPARVYTEAQARKFVKIFAEYQRTRMNLSSRAEDTIEKLSRVVRSGPVRELPKKGAPE